MTEVKYLSPAELDRLNDHYVKEAKKLRAEMFGHLFSGLFSYIAKAVTEPFSRPRTLAGSTR